MNILTRLLFALLTTVFVVSRIFVAGEYNAEVADEAQCPCSNCPCWPRVYPFAMAVVRIVHIEHSGTANEKNYKMQSEH